MKKSDRHRTVERRFLPNTPRAVLGGEQAERQRTQLINHKFTDRDPSLTDTVDNQFLGISARSLGAEKRGAANPPAE